MASAFKGAIHFARVVTSDVANALRVTVFNYEMDQRLTMYFRERKVFYAKNSIKSVKEGDYVLIRELPEPERNITHVVEKLIYERGNFIDPLSGKKCAGVEYIDDIKRTSEIFGVVPPYIKS